MQAIASFRHWRQQRRDRLRVKLRSWITRKRDPEVGPVILHRRRIYIIPSKLGFAYGLLLFCMLLGAMNYANSMAFGLTFLLAGVGLVAMHHTHRNLLNLNISVGHHEPVFAGQTLTFEIVLENPTLKDKIAIGLHWLDDEAQTYVDVPSQGRVLFNLSVAARKRGLQAGGRFTVHTSYPLALFYAWNYVELDMHGLVYPAPESGRSEPPPARGEGRGRNDGLTGQEDYAGLRLYQRRDPPRLIHWKAFPRNRQLVVKQFADPMSDSLWLDWESLAGLPVEERLSRLCRWILEAHRAGLNYGLRMPNLSYPPACDEGHRHRCLEALALFDGRGAI